MTTFYDKVHNHMMALGKDIEVYKARKARIAELEAELAATQNRIAELEANILAAGSAFCIDGKTDDLLAAEISLVRMAHEGRAALDELSRQPRWTRITDDPATWPPNDDCDYLTITWNPYIWDMDIEINKGTFLCQTYNSPETAEIDWQKEPEYWLRLPSLPITSPEPES